MWEGDSLDGVGAVSVWGRYSLHRVEGVGVCVCFIGVLHG